jgi:hypothetical protein
MPQSVIVSAPAIRLSCSVGSLLLMMVWEVLTPRRSQTVGRRVSVAK